MTPTLTIEMAPFATASGITEAQLLNASERLERDFLSKADGYLGRVLVRKDSNAWADIVFWKSGEHAAKAMEAVGSSEACRAYFACMQEADSSNAAGEMVLFSAVRCYGAVSL